MTLAKSPLLSGLTLYSSAMWELNQSELATGQSSMKLYLKCLIHSYSLTNLVGLILGTSDLRPDGWEIISHIGLSSASVCSTNFTL